MDEQLIACGKTYRIRRMLGHGKGGYSYLAEAGEQPVVIKQIHHEPCGYYAFGNKIEAEQRDYERLLTAGIRIPRMLAVDPETERIVKEYIEGPTIFELIKNGESAEPWLAQVRDMAARATALASSSGPACSTSRSASLSRSPLRAASSSAGTASEAFRVASNKAVSSLIT